MEAREQLARSVLSTTGILGIEFMSLFFKREQHSVLDYTSWWHRETENCTFNTNPFWMSFKRRWDCILLFLLRGFKNYTVSPRVFIHVCNDLNISMLSHVNTKETDKQTKQHKKSPYFHAVGNIFFMELANQLPSVLKWTISFPNLER